MRLIALYSVFDGEELLEGSVRQIRGLVDFVLCSVQTVSYTGQKYEGGLEKARELKRMGLVDEVAVYTPSGEVGTQINELRKRFGAIQLGYKAGFSHFIHMDCDEYYLPEEFARVKQFVEEGGFDGSLVYSKTYFKRPDWVMDDVDRTFFTFIHKYRADLACCGSNFPYVCDPTRTVNAKNIKVLDREMITLHHYSWVRNDVLRKLRNSSTGGVMEAAG